jgi:predicted dehydrogenase
VSSPAPQLRLGVLGCGRVFQRFHLPALSRIASIQLMAACDTDRRQHQWAQGRSSSPLLFGSLDDLIRHADVEALLVLTPPASHAEVVVRALDAGLHVLVEKPMALTPEEGAQMVQASRHAGRRLQVGFSRRFRDPYRRLRERVRQLEPGQLRAVRFELAFPTRSWGAQTDFLGNDSRGGGVLDDVLSHQIDLICWLWALPVEVRSEAGSLSGGAVRVELRLGNVLMQCEAAHGAYLERLELELSDGMVLEATGSALRKGPAAFPALRRHRARIGDQLSLLNDRLFGRTNTTLNSFEAQLRDFERGIRGGQSDGASGEDGLRVIQIVEACRESMCDGGKWRRLTLSARPAA